MVRNRLDTARIATLGCRAAFAAVALVACGESGDGGASTPRDGGGLDAGAGDGGASPGAGGAGHAGGASAGGGNTASGGSGSGGKSAAGGTAGGAASGGNTASGGSGGGGEPGPIECRQDGDGTTTLVFVNRCGESLTYRGSDIDGGTLAPGAFACVNIGTATETLSAKRYWGFVGDDPGNEHYTLAEFTFNTDFNDFDWYNISHVDAHNLPMRIEPVARPNCKTLTCAEEFLSGCPEVGRVLDANGEVVVCVSPDRNDGESPVATYFETCDDAYAWSGDDQNGDDPSPVRACAGEDWDITFCPQ